MLAFSKEHIMGLYFIKAILLCCIGHRPVPLLAPASRQLCARQARGANLVEAAPELMRPRSCCPVYRTTTLPGTHHTRAITRFLEFESQSRSYCCTGPRPVRCQLGHGNPLSCYGNYNFADARRPGGCQTTRVIGRTLWPSYLLLSPTCGSRRSTQSRYGTKNTRVSTLGFVYRLTL